MPCYYIIYSVGLELYNAERELVEAKRQQSLADSGGVINVYWHKRVSEAEHRVKKAKAEYDFALRWKAESLPCEA